MNKSNQVRLTTAFIFLPFLTILLFLDSEMMVNKGFDGQFLVNILLPLYFVIMLSMVDRNLRILMIIMVPLSYLGELLCSPGLEMYLYRKHNIPFYVPFGHAVIYGTISIIAGMPMLLKYKKHIQHAFVPFYVVLMIGVVVFFNDTLTLFLGLLFFAALYRKKWHEFYLIMGLLVLLLELVGTYFACWTWEPESLFVFKTINPPVGAIFIYVGGDMILMKLAVSVFKIQKLR